MANKELPALSEVQMEIMNLVWAQGEATVAGIWRELSQKRELTRNTVGTLVQRLEDKGWLSHREVGNTFYFTATVPKEKTVGTILGKMVDSVFEGSVEGMVMALLENRPLSSAEAKRIRQMIDEAESHK